MDKRLLGNSLFSSVSGPNSKLAKHFFCSTFGLRLQSRFNASSLVVSNNVATFGGMRPRGPLVLLSVATAAASRLSAREFVAFFGATLGLRLQSRFKAVFGPRPRHSHRSHYLPRDYISHQPRLVHTLLFVIFISTHYRIDLHTAQNPAQV